MILRRKIHLQLGGVIRIPFLLALLVLASCKEHTQLGASVVPAKPSSGANSQGGEWGPESSGLRLRVSAAATLSIGDNLVVKIQCSGNPSGNPQGRDLLSMYDFHDSLAVELRDANRPDAEPIILHQYQSGMPPLWDDPGESARPCAGMLESVEVTSLSAPVADKLRPGKYRCIARVDLPDRSLDENRLNFAQGVSDKAKRCWYGKVVSAPIDINVVETAPKVIAFQAPTRMRISGGNAFYEKSDSEEVRFEVPVGFGYAYSYSFDNGRGGLTGGTPSPSEQFQQVGAAQVCEMSVFVTNEPAGHMWMPQSGSGYRVVWHKKFELLQEPVTTKQTP